MRPAALWQVTYERRESLQNIVDSYFNVAMNIRNMLQALVVLFRRAEHDTDAAACRALRRRVAEEAAVDQADLRLRHARLQAAAIFVLRSSLLKHV